MRKFLLVLLSGSNHKFIFAILSFKQSSIQRWQVKALAELIDKWGVFTGYVTWVVRGGTVLITETNLVVRIFFDVELFWDAIHNGVNNLLVVLVRIRCFQNSSEMLQAQLRNKFGISKWLEVTTVLEYSSWISNKLFPLLFTDRASSKGCFFKFLNSTGVYQFQENKKSWRLIWALEPADFRAFPSSSSHVVSIFLFSIIELRKTIFSINIMNVSSDRNEVLRVVNWVDHRDGE